MSVCQWQTSCELTEPAGETSAPKVLPLTLKGRRQEIQKEAAPSSYLPSPLEAPNRAAHTPQPAARFRKLGKRCFPNFRREADALHKRWEARRSR